MTFLLDTNVVSYFLQAGREADLAKASKLCPMALVEEVYRELEADTRRGGRPFLRWFSTANIDVHQIKVGSPASMTLAELRALKPPNSNLQPPNKDRGERASIALAAFDSSLTFVAHDKVAMWIALRELWVAGERLVGVPVFIRRLFDAGALSVPKIADEIINQIKPAQPTWWASWRAGLTVPSPAPLTGGQPTIDVRSPSSTRSLPSHHPPDSSPEE